MKKLLIMVIWVIVAVNTIIAMVNTFDLLLGTIATTKPIEKMSGAEIATHIAIDVLCGIIIGVFSYIAYKLQKGGDRK